MMTEETNENLEKDIHDIFQKAFKDNRYIKIK